MLLLEPDLIGNIEFELRRAECRRSSWLYRRERSRIVFASLGASGQSLLNLLVHRREMGLRSLRKSSRVVEEFARILSESANTSVDGNSLSRLTTSKSFMRIDGSILPVLIDAEIDQVNLPTSPSILLRRSRVLRPVAALVDVILNRDFVRMAVPYRMETRGLRRKIFGNDSPSILSLGGVAHELGHYLAESSPSLLVGPMPWVSETIAHLFEEHVVLDVLEEIGLHAEAKAWARYQRKIDALNMYFFNLECADLQIADNPLPDIFGQRIVVRESLFTTPGYQSSYAVASLARISSGLDPREVLSKVLHMAKARRMDA